MKDCPTCRTPRDESEFNRNRSRQDGLHGECRYCHNERSTDWRARNLERARAYGREYQRRRRAKQKAGAA